MAVGVVIALQLVSPAFNLGLPWLTFGRLRPLHTNAVEHEQFVVSGRARITVGSEVHDVAAGHALYIPAGVPHSYEVVEGPFEFLCVVPNLPDKIEILAAGC